MYGSIENTKASACGGWPERWGVGQARCATLRGARAFQTSASPFGSQRRWGRPWKTYGRMNYDGNGMEGVLTARNRAAAGSGRRAGAAADAEISAHCRVKKKNTGKTPEKRTQSKADQEINPDPLFCFLRRSGGRTPQYPPSAPPAAATAQAGSGGGNYPLRRA